MPNKKDKTEWLDVVALFLVMLAAVNWALFRWMNFDVMLWLAGKAGILVMANVGYLLFVAGAAWLFYKKVFMDAPI